MPERADDVCDSDSRSDSGAIEEQPKWLARQLQVVGSAGSGCDDVRQWPSCGCELRPARIAAAVAAGVDAAGVVVAAVGGDSVVASGAEPRNWSG